MDIVVIQLHDFSCDQWGLARHIQGVEARAEEAVGLLVAVVERVPVEPQLYRVALVRQDLQVVNLVGGARLRRARPAALGLDPVDPVFQPVAVGVVDQRDLAVRVAGELVVVIPGGHPELGVFAVQREPLVPLPVIEQPCFAVQKRLDVVIPAYL